MITTVTTSIHGTWVEAPTLLIPVSGMPSVEDEPSPLEVPLVGAVVEVDVWTILAPPAL